MATITVYVCPDIKAFIREGYPLPPKGDDLVAIPIELSALDAEARDLLADAVDPNTREIIDPRNRAFVLTVSAPTAEAVVDALRTIATREAEKREEAIQSILAAPPSAWIDRTLGKGVFTYPDGTVGDGQGQNWVEKPMLRLLPRGTRWVANVEEDPRVRARRQEVADTLYAEQLAAWERLDAEWRAARTALLEGRQAGADAKAVTHHP